MKPKTTVIRLLSWCLIGLMSALLASHSRHYPAAAQTSSGSDLVARVNAFRTAQGMPALIPDPALMAAAQRQANWNAAQHASSHRGEGDTMPQDRAAAAGYTGYVQENVADGTLGYVTATWAVEQLWASSYGHRLTMLAEATHVGGGVAADTEKEYFVLLVGRPSSNFPPPPGADWGPGPASTPDVEPDTGTEEVVSPAPVVVPIVLAEPDANGNVYHVVQAGQTAWAIAARYGVSLDDLLALNGLQRSTLLKPGDRLLVRLGEGQVAPAMPTPQQRVVVQAGQTIWEIAVTHGLTVDELLAFNGLTRADTIQPGDELWLCPPENATETVPTLAPSATVTPTPRPTLTAMPDPTTTPTTERVTTTPVAAAQVATARLTSTPPPATPTIPPGERDPDSSAWTDQGVIIAAVVVGIVALVLIRIGLSLWLGPGRHTA